MRAFNTRNRYADAERGDKPAGTHAPTRLARSGRERTH